MSVFQQGLDMFKSAAKNLKEIEDEPIPEDIKPVKESKEPSAKTTLNQIKAQAREKVDKELSENNNTQSLLDKFKRFLSREKRNKFLMLCEKEDSGKLNFTSMMAFGRVLKSMGFRLLFDEVKNLIIALNVYDANKDRVYYLKVIGSTFRKLYRRDPYIIPPKPSQLQAIVIIQRYLKQKKNRKLEKVQKKKENITPKEILNGLAQKIQKSGKPLLRVFEEIDKDHSGFIELSELDSLFQAYGVMLSQEHLGLVFKLIDTENLEKINYRSLLKAVENYVPTSEDVLSSIAITKEEKEKVIQSIVASIKLLFKDSKMTADSTYKLFDKDGTGSINLETFINVIGRITSGFSQFQIRQVFNYIDTSNDKFISKVEFSRVFFDIFETPTEILKRKEQEEKKRIEEEIKAKWEKQRNSLNEPPPQEQPKDLKPSILDEIKKKQLEIEEKQQKEALMKLDPNFARMEEKKQKDKELDQRRKKEIEEKTKLENERKKKHEDEKKKRDQDEKNAKNKMGNFLKNLGKPKEDSKSSKMSTPKRSGSVAGTGRSGLRKKETVKKTLEEKAGKVLGMPTEHQAVLRQHQKELAEMFKKEFIFPLVERVVNHGDSILLARQGQKAFETRPVIKHVFRWNREWSQEVINPVPRSLWISGELGRAGFIDDQGYLNQLDLLTGNAFPVLHLGTKPPFQRTPLLASACDPSTNRLYLLNKQWVLEVWDLHQQTTCCKKRIKVLSKVVADDYIERFYKSRHRNVFPKLLSINESGKIIINATSVDGFLYFFEPISLTLLFRLRLTIKDLQIPEAVLKAFEEFSYFIRDCSKLGISQKRVFELLDRNNDGLLSINEFREAVKINNLPISENQIKAMFKLMDKDLSGSISIDEFWGGLYLRDCETAKKETEVKNNIDLPEWVNNINANERAKDCMYKLFRAIESRGLSSEEVFKRLDQDKSGSLSRSEFSKGLLSLLAPLITISDCELLLQIADRDNSGMINYKEFSQFLSLNKLGPGKMKKVDSQSLPRASIKYVIHKCIELGIDFYKICKEQDKAGTGTLPKEAMSAILLSIPVAISLKELKVITERDFLYSASGCVDYQEIFDREEYVELIKQGARPGISFEIPMVQEEAAIIEDFEYLEDLGLVAFSTNNPVSSVVYIKSVKGNLVAKCIGHFGEYPPVLKYIQSANTLVSGERRDMKNQVLPALPPCEIVLWNLQKDLISKFAFNPPWTVKPYIKVFAHETGIIDIDYLPVTQLLVSTAVDGCIKFWNPTGRPYALTEIHNLPIAAEKPGVYLPLKPQYTTSNSLMTCVGTIVNKEYCCFRVLAHAFGKSEWMVTLNLIPSSSKSICGNLQSWGFKRMAIQVPAKEHDWEVPNSIQKSLHDLFLTHRQKSLSEYRAGLTTRLEKILNNSKVQKSFEKEIKTSIIRSIIFDTNHENSLKIIAVLPERLKKGKVSPEEFFNYLVQFAGFLSIPFPEYLRLLSELSESLSKLKESEKKPQIGLLTVLKMIEDKKNPQLKIVSPVKPPNSLITSIKAEKKNHEALFDTPMKDLEQELFEYLAFRLMEKKVQLGTLFAEIDSDQDGLISVEEFSQFLQKLGFNLRKSEVKSIMKCVDYNSDGTISFKELETKLKAFGYTEEWQGQIYSHEWEDVSLQCFFKNFTKKNEYRTIYEFLQKFDYNKDGNLTIFELMSAIFSVDKVNAERILNIVLVSSKNDLGITDVAKALSILEKELPKSSKQNFDYKSMETCLKSYNSLELLRITVENLAIYCLSLGIKSRRGLELLSRQYRLNEGLSLLASGTIRYQEQIDRILSCTLSRIYKRVFDNLIKPEFNVLTNTFPLDPASAKKVDPADFKVAWDSESVLSPVIKIYPGSLLPDLDQIKVCVFEPEGLKHVSRDGTSLYNHVIKELGIHSALQDKLKNLVHCIGFHEKYLGLDKTIFSLYSTPLGTALTDLLTQNGGLLKIPLLYNTKVSVFLMKYWGRKILTTINTLQSYSIALRYCSPDKIFITENGSEILLSSLQGLGTFDSNGKIVTGADLTLFSEKNIEEDPYVAPEFYMSNTQTVACDTWSFGILMYHLLFGAPPVPYLTKYDEWNKKKFVSSKLKEKNLLPASSFPYNIFEDLEIVAGRAEKSEMGTLQLLRTLKAGSFSGIVYEQPCKTEIEEIEANFKVLKDLKNTKSEVLNEIGKALDAIFLCLQIDPKKRPSIRALLESPAFVLDKYEEKQAKSFAALIFEHKNPEIVISLEITQNLKKILKDPTAENADDIINLIEKLGSALLDYGETIAQTTASAIFSTNLSNKEKDLLSKKNASSPITELSSQCIKDDIFSIICQLSLHYFSQGDNSVLLVFSNLLKYLLFHLNSEESGLSILVSVLIETLLKLFIGESNYLASKKYIPGYVLIHSKWTPELYEIMAPVYRQSISESGHGQHNCPVIKEYLSKNRSAEYYSELMMISENFHLILKPESTTVAKRNALRHLKSMLQTRNEYKLMAALDFRMPQFVVHGLQDSDFKVRLEAIEIFHFLTQGCIEPLLPPLPGVSKDYRSLGMINFFSVAKKETHETTKNFEKYSKLVDQSNNTGTIDIKLALKMLSECFESPMFIFPIVRLIKFKSEPYETKELAVKILISALSGNEKTQLACLSPITDSISTLCKCLVVSTKTSDKKSGKTLAPMIKGLLSNLLANARSYVLAAFKNTPGAEALLKEQNLVIPEKITLQGLAYFKGEPNIEHNIAELVQGLKNWLIHEKSSETLSAKEMDIVMNCMKFLRNAVDVLWEFADVKADEKKFIDKTATSIKQVKEKVNLSLQFLEWTLFSDLDYGWFKVEDNVSWLISRTTFALQSAGSGFEVFYLEEESMLLQRILCRLLVKDKSNILLGKLKFGYKFAEQLIIQYQRLGEIISKHTEPLHILSLYPKTSEVRLATFMNLLQFKNLQSQMLENEFIGVLVEYFLNDFRVLNVRFNKLSLEFLPFRETPPVRSEAINIVMMILKEKSKCKVVYDDLLLHLQRFKTVQGEVMNCLSNSLVLQATALELVQAFIESEDSQLEYLLMQANAKEVLRDLFLGNKDLPMRFPLIANYCKS